MRELYVRGDAQIANDSLVRAALIEGAAMLGERTSIMRWIYSTGDLEAGVGSRLFGRAASDGSITLAHGCQFERLRAKTICAGAQSVAASQPDEGRPRSSLIDMRLGRVRSNGDFHLRDSDVFQGHIIAAGRVAIEGNVLVFGSVKARTDVEIGSRTQVQGTVVSGGHCSIADHCFLKGPVMSEGEIVIGTGTQIGTPDAPTSVSAPRVRIAPGAVVCGSITAREGGEVSS
jgi:cytoskeletal protein CcmA (bactofilin family)